MRRVAGLFWVQRLLYGLSVIDKIREHRHGPHRKRLPSARRPWQNCCARETAHFGCLSQWKRTDLHFTLVENKRRAAAIVPRLFSHGNFLVHDAQGDEFSALQLCHGFSAMETGQLHIHHNPAKRRCNCATAFQPWKRVRATRSGHGLNSLQLCHGFSAMETSLLNSI
jgi:hypothetical protein